MKTIATVVLPDALRARWRALEVQKEWSRTYPMLFDKEDLRLATGPQGRTGYHLVEWLGAIIAHTLTGHHALVCKYQMPSHRRKRLVVQSLGLESLLLRRPARFGRQQAPDLLLYTPDLSSWTFCEVKGPGDKLGDDQSEYFKFLSAQSGVPIQLIRLNAEVRRAGV